LKMFANLCSLKYLKTVYILAHLKLCLIISIFYLYINSNDYFELIDVSELDSNSLSDLVNSRGILTEDQMSRVEMEKSLSETGKRKRRTLFRILTLVY